MHEPRTGPVGTAVDPDVDRCRARRRDVPEVSWSVLVAVATGGVIGAAARHGLDRAVPAQHGQFPWPTFTVNVTGCLLIGALMVLLTQARPPHRLARPFLGTGLLGGYTTFSAHVGDVLTLIAGGAAGTALVYLAGTLLCALAAVRTGMGAARMWVARRSKGAGA